MLPTNIAKANVFNIQASDKSEVNKEMLEFADSKILKSFKINIPKITPPKRESKTFLVYSAKKIANNEGRRESDESSIIYLSKLYCKQD